MAYNLLEVVKEFRFFWQDSLFSISVSIGMTDIGTDDLSAEQTLKKPIPPVLLPKKKAATAFIYSTRMMTSYKNNKPKFSGCRFCNGR